MGEGVGQGVGVGRRAILVFFWVFGFFRFWIFLGGRLCGWAGFCVGACEKGGCPPPPLIGEVFGGDGVRQGCLVWLVCCVHDRDACVECGGRRGQDVGGAWNVRKPRRWLREEKGPVVCVPAP